jgi:hypothetical protein
MDEARMVLKRLRRIELLERGEAPPQVVLEEVRALLEEAEAWVRAEPGGTERAAEALDQCREALESPFVTSV